MWTTEIIIRLRRVVVSGVAGVVGGDLVVVGVVGGDIVVAHDRCVGRAVDNRNNQKISITQ